MFDDLILNLKKSFKTPSVGDRDETDGSTVAFIERRDFDLDAPNRTNLIGIFRSYFNRFNQKNVTDGNTNCMLPRVYAPDDVHHFDWDPIELKAKEKYIEDIDNVVDKFARVISVNETASPRRNRFFYVYKNVLEKLLTEPKILMHSFSIYRNEMIVRKSVDVWRWAPKMII